MVIWTEKPEKADGKGEGRSAYKCEYMRPSYTFSHSNWNSHGFLLFMEKWRQYIVLT